MTLVGDLAGFDWGWGIVDAVVLPVWTSGSFERGVCAGRVRLRQFRVWRFRLGLPSHLTSSQSSSFSSSKFSGSATRLAEELTNCGEASGSILIPRSSLPMERPGKIRVAAEGEWEDMILVPMEFDFRFGPINSF